MAAFLRVDVVGVVGEANSRRNLFKPNSNMAGMMNQPEGPLYSGWRSINVL